MGLSATAYTNAHLLPGYRWRDADWDRNDLMLTYWFPEFAHATEGLALPAPKNRGDVVFAVDPTPWRDRVSASASYRGYSAFRDRLATLSGKAKSAELQPGEPFWEMCWMSDCEGFFSTAACKRVAADFDDHREAIHAPTDDDPLRHWPRLYDQWGAAFRHAADRDGIVTYT